MPACSEGAPKGGDSSATASSPRWPPGVASVALDPEERGGNGRSGWGEAGGQRREGALFHQGHAMVRHRVRGGMGAGGTMATVRKKTSFPEKPPGRFKIFASKSNFKLFRFKRGS